MQYPNAYNSDKELGLIYQGRATDSEAVDNPWDIVYEGIREEGLHRREIAT